MRNFLLIGLVLHMSLARAQHSEWLQFPSSLHITALKEQGNIMWVSSQTGLYRIDKETSSAIVYNNANSPLADNYITALTVQDDTTIWIGSLDGGLMRLQGSQWTFFNSENSSLPTNYVSALDVDGNGNLWIGSGRKDDINPGLLLKFDGVTWTSFEDVEHPLDIIAEDTNLIWIRHGEQPATLVKFNGSEIVEEYYPSEWSQCGCFYAFDIDSRGHKWLASDNLAEFNDSTFVIYETGFPAIYDVVIDASDRPWITTNNGIAGLGDEGWTYYPIPESTDNWVINRLAIDSENNKWVGTDGNGLYKYDTTWHSLIQGLPFDITNDLAIEENGNVWAATSRGLASYDGVDWTLFDTSNSQLPDNTVMTVAIENGNIVWAGTLYGGIVRIEDDDWQLYDADSVPLPTNSTTCIVVDEDDVKWISHGEEPGLTTYDNADWFTYTSINSGLPYDMINQVEIGQGNIKWIRGREGRKVSPQMLTSFDGDEWSNYPLPQDPDSAYAWLSYLAVDTSGSVWATTTEWNGNFNGETWEILGEESPDYIFIGPDGSRWMNWNGLVKITDNGWNVYTTTNSGIPDNEINALEYDPGGVLWVATDAGVAAFDASATEIYTKRSTAQTTPLVYPNPAKGDFTVQLPDDVTIQSVKLYNAAGLTVIDLKPVSSTLRVGKLPPGVYFIRIYTETETVTSKLMVVSE